ncbi:hypothetical protein OEB99_18740 [Actinotalea sp. M2MS4P-6]|uniref:hypothetical protein n=1 Tax=Actinotalea sp. M2MS4P-6 TaxID=2983762 RepID=UPI0021E411BB|nr:hypothetical protein [Actinotalea sp. M2MS4P-6]MCV2396353.1 hypothetical protein [Actinotalea sp. M2MS4P-6]
MQPTTELQRRPSILHRNVSLPVATAFVAIVIIAARLPIMMNVTFGSVVAAALAPVWVPTLARYRGVRLLMGALLLAAASGIWLTKWASIDHATSTSLMLATTVTLLNVGLGTGVVLWARTIMSRAAIGIAFGIGLVAGISTGGRFAENPWRFGFAAPVIILALSFAWYSRRRWLEVGLAGLLAAITALSGGRSLAAMLFVAAVVTMWNSLPRPRTPRGSRMRIAAMLALLGFAVYQVGLGLILDGYLGENTQQRTAEQIAASGSVLLGARPELGASMALMVDRPIGFGSGTSPNTQDVLTAKAGMAKLNYDPNNNYVETYMLGTAVELHSVTADLWALYGIPGLFVALLIGIQVIRGLITQLAARDVAALTAYLAISTVWNLGFSPFFTSSHELVLALGLLAIERRAKT